MIVSSFLIASGLSGINQTLLDSAQDAPLKNIITIENYDNSMFESLPYIKNSYVDFESLLDLGILSYDTSMEYLPIDCSHIKLKSGRLPSKNNEVIITYALSQKIKDTHLTYNYNDTILDLKVVGVLKEDFFKEECVYFPVSFRYEISDYINQQVVIVESEDQSLYETLKKDYIVSSTVKESVDSYSYLLKIGRFIACIFFMISMLSSFLLFYIMYSTIIKERIHDSALLISMGIKKKRLFFLQIYESIIIGVLLSLLGNIICLCVYYYINNIYKIYNVLSFQLNISTYYYLFNFLFYTLFCLISSLLPIYKGLSNNIISLLRED
jgi:ABC-type antimicrobial peptide transport system permease subunit